MTDSTRLLDSLERALEGLDPAAGPGLWLQQLVRAGADRLPLPGSGATLLRWQALARVAARDLSLVKLYEGHADALAILSELDASRHVSPAASIAVWAAEGPASQVEIGYSHAGGRPLLNGHKAWCSGAAAVSCALVTARHADGRGSQLALVSMDQPERIRISLDSWQAVGMAGSGSADVEFDAAEARLIGQPGDYIGRPGFWQGGAGIAACWYGGALALAMTLRQAMTAAGSSPSAFRLAALGRTDVALQRTASMLRQAALWIDAHPRSSAAAMALRVRLCAEDCTKQVLDEVGRALGAAPYCREPRFARMAADLPVFVRQSHAERDQAALGEWVQEEQPWAL